MIKGVDLSTWNENVDYEALKRDGIEFALIRCGYGKDNGQKDEDFEKHYAGCKAAGIKVGVYHYSYCSCVENAELEAQNCLSYIEGKELDLPVFYDLEEEKIAALGMDQVTQIALRFCKKIKEAGYKAGVYANLNWFRNYIRPQALIIEGNYIWLAQWNSEITADFNVDVWQNTNHLLVGNITCDGDYLLNESLLNNETPTPTPISDINVYQSLAIDVIYGRYGNGEERKQALGDYYEETQKIVNDIYEIIEGD